VPGLGFSYGDMERDDGVLLAVAEACCRYRSPARYDDEVIVKTWIEEANSRMATFNYEMRLAEGGVCWLRGTRATFLWTAKCGGHGCRRSTRDVRAGVAARASCQSMVLIAILSWHDWMYEEDLQHR